MTTISGFIDGITSGAIPPEKHDYYLRVISDEVHRLSRLVTDLLDISRLESGERKFNFERFDVAEMARIILISFEQSIEEKHLDVMFESDSDVMMVYADKDAIHQVIYNLCHNAIKFAKDGGKFAISITVDLNKKTRISVYDEGVSINREELPFIFDRFYKTDKSRGLDKSGVGLGLYICKTIIDSHGEEIKAESPNDNGAEFWFTLSDSDPRKRQTK
jgi:signal transduction histidine kinase